MRTTTKDNAANIHWRRRTAPVRNELQRTCHAAGRSQQDVEQRGGLGRGTFGNLLAGQVDLKVWQLFAVLSAVGTDPGTFFARCYPPTGALERVGPTQDDLSEDELRDILDALARSGLGDVTDLKKRLERCEAVICELVQSGVLSSR